MPCGARYPAAVLVHTGAMSRAAGAVTAVFGAEPYRRLVVANSIGVTGDALVHRVSGRLAVLQRVGRRGAADDPALPPADPGPLRHRGPVCRHRDRPVPRQPAGSDRGDEPRSRDRDGADRGGAEEPRVLPARRSSCSCSARPRRSRRARSCRGWSPTTIASSPRTRGSHVPPHSWADWPEPRVRSALALGSTEAVLRGRGHRAPRRDPVRHADPEDPRRRAPADRRGRRAAQWRSHVRRERAKRDASRRRVPRVLHRLQPEGGRRARVVLRPRDRRGRRRRLLRHLHRRVPPSSPERGDAARVGARRSRGSPRSSLPCSTRTRRCSSSP